MELTQTLVVDFGGTSTKALLYARQAEQRKLCFDSGKHACSADGLRTISAAFELDVTQLANIVTTGGTSAALPANVDGVPVRAVNELLAMGTGGLRGADIDAALIVSIGTGTPMAVARRTAETVEVQHVGGLGLGGGTIMGLGRLLCGVDTFDALDALALQGKTERVDLLVGDIVGRGIGVVPAELTASNFGKAARPGAAHSQADLAAGLFTMVGQSVARLAIKLAQHAGVEPIVVVGQVIENAYMREVFGNISKLFGGRFVFLDESRYTAAKGAFEVVSKQN